MSLLLLLGGARSGKSDLGLRLAAQHASPVTLIATAEARDPEMAARIARHREERPPAWRTVEEPLDLADAIAGTPPEHVLLIDCLTLWVSNLIETTSAVEVESEAARAARLAAGREALTIVVSNEVGLGIVPGNPLARRYRDLLGRVNSIWSEAAEDAYLVVAGRLLALRRSTELESRG